MRRVAQARVCHPQSKEELPTAPTAHHYGDRNLASSVSQFSTEDIPAAPEEDRSSDHKLAYSVSEFSKASDLSRSLLYEAIRLGELQSVKVRGRRLILVEDGKAWLRSFRGGGDER